MFRRNDIPECLAQHLEAQGFTVQRTTLHPTTARSFFHMVITKPPCNNYIHLTLEDSDLMISKFIGPSFGDFTGGLHLLNLTDPDSIQTLDKITGSFIG